MLAEYYLNFPEFDQISFLVFRDRLSAAILVANSTRQSVDQVKENLEQDKANGTRRAPDWERESDLALVENALEISIGGAMLTAVAALESLLKDLAPDSETV
jgi:hypothetical protein